MGEESTALKAANKTQQTVGLVPALPLPSVPLQLFQSGKGYMFPILHLSWTCPSPTHGQEFPCSLVLKFHYHIQPHLWSFSPQGIQSAWLHLMIQTLLLKYHTFADSSSMFYKGTIKKFSNIHFLGTQVAAAAGKWPCPTRGQFPSPHEDKKEHTETRCLCWSRSQTTALEGRSISHVATQEAHSGEGGGEQQARKESPPNFQCSVRGTNGRIQPEGNGSGLGTAFRLTLWIKQRHWAPLHITV